MRTCVRSLPSLGLPRRHPPSLSWRLAALPLQASLLAQPLQALLLHHSISQLLQKRRLSHSLQSQPAAKHHHRYTNCQGLHLKRYDVKPLLSY